MSGKETKVENINKTTWEEAISAIQPNWARVGAMEVISDGRFCIYLQGRADRFADELYIWCERERKVKDDPMRVTPSNWLKTKFSKNILLSVATCLLY